MLTEIDAIQTHSSVTPTRTRCWGRGGISGGFLFPIYTFRFSLNQRRLARANLVIRKKKVSFLVKKTKADAHNT